MYLIYRNRQLLNSVYNDIDNGKYKDRVEDLKPSNTVEKTIENVKLYAMLQTFGVSQGMESLKYMIDGAKGSGEEGGANGKATPLSASTVPGAKHVSQSFGYKEPTGNYSRKVADAFSFDMSETAKNNYFGEEGVKKMEQRKDPSR